MSAVSRNLARGFGLVASIPFRFRKDRISPPRTLSHTRWADTLAQQFNREGVRILEIGSRNVTGANLRSKFSKASYVGFDYYSGENVDVVGDVHKLSKYFGDQKFDLIFSSAVFEHLYMPWVAAEQIQKVLAVGGYVFVETHFSYSSHERPWHFFQFSDMALRALFNESLGFDLIESGMSNPMSGYFGHMADGYLRYTPVAELYCHSSIYCRKRCEVPDFNWNQVTVEGIVGESRYPPPEQS